MSLFYNSQSYNLLVVSDSPLDERRLCGKARRRRAPLEQTNRILYHHHDDDDDDGDLGAAQKLEEKHSIYTLVRYYLEAILQTVAMLEAVIPR